MSINTFLIEYGYMLVVWGYAILKLIDYIRDNRRKYSPAEKINKLIAVVINNETAFRLTQQEFKGLTNTVRMINDSVLIKLLFQYPSILTILRHDTLSESLTNIYQLGEAHGQTVKDAITGLMVMQTKLKCYEESHDTRAKIPHSVYALPADKINLFKQLIIVNKWCIKLKIDNEVFGHTLNHDFIYKLALEMQLCRDINGKPLVWN